MLNDQATAIPLDAIWLTTDQCKTINQKTRIKNTKMHIYLLLCCCFVFGQCLMAEDIYV